MEKTSGSLRFGRLHWPRSFSIAAQRLRKYSHRKGCCHSVSFSTISLFSTFSGNYATLRIASREWQNHPLLNWWAYPGLLFLTMGHLTLAYAISLGAAIAIGVWQLKQNGLPQSFPSMTLDRGYPSGSVPRTFAWTHNNRKPQNCPRTHLHNHPSYSHDLVHVPRHNFLRQEHTY